MPLNHTLTSKTTGYYQILNLRDFACLKFGGGMCRLNDKYPANVVIHWLSNKDTTLYVGLWEELNNEKFILK